VVRSYAISFGAADGPVWVVRDLSTRRLEPSDLLGSADRMVDLYQLNCHDTRKEVVFPSVAGPRDEGLPSRCREHAICHAADKGRPAGRIGGGSGFDAFVARIVLVEGLLRRLLALPT
jgi:hypothetical protein